MTFTPITNLPDAPQRGQPVGTFNTKANAWVAAIDDWTDEVNDIASFVETKADETENNAISALNSAASALVSSQSAISSANYKGLWSNLTGALNIPASVSHNNSLWLLLEYTADVTAEQPSVSSKWQLVHSGVNTAYTSFRNGSSELGYMGYTDETGIYRIINKLNAAMKIGTNNTEALNINQNGTITSSTAVGVSDSSISNIGSLKGIFEAKIVDGILNLTGAGVGNASAPFVSFKDSNNTVLGYAGYLSTNNSNLSIRNQANAPVEFYTNGINRVVITASGNLVSTNFSQLGGSSAPSIKMKKFTGTTNAAEGGFLQITHGLTSSKILDISVRVFYYTNGSMAPEFTGISGYQYHSDHDGSCIYVTNHTTNSENILSKPCVITVTYEE